MLFAASVEVKMHEMSPSRSLIFWACTCCECLVGGVRTDTVYGMRLPQEVASTVRRYVLEEDSSERELVSS